MIQLKNYDEKDYQKAEYITQESNAKQNVSFKYYIYMVAKSRAINYINVKKKK